MTNESTKNIFPLTSNQKLIWSEQRIYPVSPLYNICTYIAIDGFVDPDLLQRATQIVIDQNDALRLQFLEIDDEPYQQFLPHLSYQQSSLDFSGEDEPVQACLDWMQTQNERCLDISSAPLFQAALLKARPQQFFWYCKIHHLINDGWGNQVHMRKITEAYNALLHRTDSSPGFPYRDYIAAESNTTDARDDRKSMAFWREYLKPLPPALFRQRPDRKNIKAARTSARQSLSISRDLYKRLSDFAADREISLYHLFLSVIYLIFSRLRDTRDLIIGLPVLNRSGQKHKSGLGLYTGVSLLRVRPGSGETIAEIVTWIRSELRRIYRHQHVPLSKIRWRLFSKEANKVTLSSLSVSFLDHHLGLRFGEAVGQLRTLSNNHQQLPLTIYILKYDDSADAQVEFDYHLSYFTPQEMARITGRFSETLNLVMDNYKKPIDQIDIFTQEDRELLVGCSGPGRSTLPKNESLAEPLSQVTEPASGQSAIMVERDDQAQCETNSAETRLINLWKKIFIRKKIGRDDHFFEIGGHSLLATRLVSMIRTEFQVEIRLISIFDNPVLKDLAVRISSLEKAARRSIPVADQKAFYPVTPQQQNLWILSHKPGAGNIYNIPMAFQIGGGIDKTALESAFQSIVQRYEILHTVFIEEDGVPFQRVLEDYGFHLIEHDLRHEADKEAAARQIIEQYATERFDLEQGPLLKVILLELEKNRHVLLINIHHIIMDGWSCEILLRELSAAYRNLPPSSTAPLLQYKDYAVGHDRKLSDGSRETQHEYWKTKLSGDWLPLALPMDHPRPALMTYRGDRLRLNLPSGITRALGNFARTHDTSPYMLLTALVKILLYHYSGQDDIVVGTVNSGRTSEECIDIIGYFVQTLPLRDQVIPEEHFSLLLQRVKQTILEADANQDYPFERIVKDLDLPLDPSRNPLFDVFISYQDSEDFKLELKALSVEKYEFAYPISKFDLSFVFEQRGEDLALDIEFNTDLYRRDRIERMAGHLIELIRNAMAHSDRRIMDLSILSKREREQILDEFNHASSSSPDDRTIVELFQEQVLKSPDRTAVEFGQSRISYRELDEEAEKAAHRLREQHRVQPGDIVAVLLEPSERFIISIMGILKAGAAYLPIDPMAPTERVRFMLRDSSSEVLISDVAGLQEVDAIPDLIVVDIDEVRTSESQIAKNHESRAPKAGPDDPAYMIYTSGTTGFPKGVLIENRSLVNLIYAQKRQIGFTQDERHLLFFSISFDGSVFNIFLALLSGACLLIPKKEILLEPENFCQFLVDSGTTSLIVTPSFLHQLSREKFPTIRWIGTGGEPVIAEDVAYYSARMDYFNFYGPTEATIVAISCRLTPESSQRDLIGTPVDNCDIFILDESMNLRPVGIAGEICIGGAGLAKGYLNRPELTADKFVTNPVRTGELLYRTGDYGCWLPDGSIEFFGRRDNQVKVRGYRVELDEIVATLHKYPGIKQAVVTTKKSDSGNARLLAYVSGDQLEQNSKTVAEIRDYLQKSLPFYMLPSSIVVVPQIPLTINQKVDFKRLSGMEVKVRGTIPAADKAVRKLCEIFGTVLGVEISGIQPAAYFFDLGATSFDLMKVRGRIRTVLGIEVPITAFFQHPSINELAAYIASGQKKEKIDPVRDSGTIPKKDKIAIIGMAGRFPGAENITEFWNNLIEGKETIHFFTEEELENEGLPPDLFRAPNYVKAFGMLSGADCFDSQFFSYPGSWAESLDPQIRIFHEVVYAALEDAGVAPGAFPHRIGLYAGSSDNYRWRRFIQGAGQTGENEGWIDYMLAIRDFLTTHVAYKLNLRGPAVFVQTGCSTSLSATHMACRSLQMGECELAIAGGVTVSLPYDKGYHYEEGIIFSPDGHCRAFDAEASGTVPGNGAGAVVLKPLEQAVRDGDYIYAVIAGTAMNNDGSLKAGFTAPAVEGQVQVIRAARQEAGCDVESIGYVETHGTGTILGDPVEISALEQAFASEKRQFCAIGSLKTNLGHLDAAAGVAGLIKTALSLNFAKIPPSLHFKTPNPQIDFEHSPFYVNTELKEWPRQGTNADPIRRAGVSSFGIGGTNMHMILEEAPRPENIPAGTNPLPRILPLSVKDPDTLNRIRTNLVDFLRKHPHSRLQDLSYSLQFGRESHVYRHAFTVVNVEEAILKLSDSISPDKIIKTDITKSSKIVFLFPESGTDFLAMGRDLYRWYPRFRQEIDSGNESLRKIAGTDVKPLQIASDSSFSLDRDGEDSEIARLVLVIFGYALGKLLESWGVRPDAVAGYGLGEYTAACFSGIMTLDEALQLALERNELLTLAQDASTARPTKRVQQFSLQTPRIPHLSGLSGAWITDQEARDSGYWQNRFSQTSPFAAKPQELLAIEYAIYIGFGSDNLFTEAFQEHPDRGPGQQLINLFPGSDQEKASPAYLLNRIADLWCMGSMIDWTAVYPGPHRKIPLPGYPFQRKRFPVKPPVTQLNQNFVSEKQEELENWSYVPSWERVPFGIDEDSETVVILLFSDGNPLEYQFLEYFRSRSLKFITVGSGAQFIRSSADRFYIRPTERDDYLALFRQLADEDLVPDKVVHLRSLDIRVRESENLEDALQKSFYGLQHIVAARTSCAIHNPVSLIVVTENLFEVQGDEEIDPIKALVTGPVLTIPQEYPEIRISLIDIDPLQIRWKGATRLPARLLAEGRDRPGHEIIAYRGRYRWKRKYTPIPLKEASPGDLPLRNKGSYLITGGSGGIGFSIAKYLAGSYQARLALVARRGVSDEMQQTLKELGADVLAFSADVADYREMQKVFSAVAERFGRIDGVIHAAGVADGAVIQNRTREQSELVLEPKVSGTLNLHRLLEGKQTDFVLLCSSLASVIPIIGQFAYCSANAFEDAFANKMSNSGDTRWCSVSWDRWLDVGMAARFLEGHEGGQIGIHTDAGIEIFKRILNRQEPHIIISTGSLDPQVEKLRDTRSVFLELKHSAGIRNTESIDGELLADTNHNRSEVKNIVLNIWRDILTLPDLDADTNLFDLGVDSLKIMDAESRIQKQFRKKIPMAEFFRLPTVRDQTAYLSGSEKEVSDSIPRQAETAYYPVSSAQKRLFILQQLTADNILYNQPAVLRIEGSIEPARLESAFRNLIETVEVFRSSFHLVEDNPVQVIHPLEEIDFHIEFSRVMGEPIDVDEIMADFLQPFDLSKPPLIRVKLLETLTGITFLLIDIHHIISDGSSYIELFDSIGKLYAGEKITPPKIRFRDYAVWQQNQKALQEYCEQGKYWLNEFSGEIPILQLPNDFCPGTDPDFWGDHLECSIGVEETRAIKALARERNTTLFIVLLAAFKILLGKLSGQEDLIVGTPTAGRRRSEFQHLIGMFVDTLAIRSRPQKEKTFNEYLSEVQEKVLKAFENQEYQFEDLVEALNVTRVSGENPIFNVMFILQNMSKPALSLDNLKISVHPWKKKLSLFDLTLEVIEEGAELRLGFEYSTWLFQRETIAQYADYYRELLHSIVAAPDSPIAEIQMLPPAMREQILHDFSNSGSALAEEKTVMEIFHEQLLKSPDRTALKFGQYRLSYRELDEEAEQVAHRLCEQHRIQPGDIVAVLLEPSERFIISVLGILKAGAAYLPIDPVTPTERIRFMLRDSCSEVVISDVAGLKNVAAIPDLIVVDIDEVRKKEYQTAESHASPAQKASPGDPVYMIYTSDTTGSPKGVLIENRALANLVCAQKRRLDFTSDERHLLFFSISFDGSVFDIFLPLLSGACLVIPKKEVLLEPENFCQFLVDSGTTSLIVTPSFLHQIPGEKFPKIRRICTAGEPVIAKDAAYYSARMDYYCHYGPTETTIMATCCKLLPESRERNLIGIPIDNCDIFILDESMNLQPIGIAGEICVGGAGLARGYLNRPELTVEKFVVNPFKTGELLYRTGDYGCWLADGSIEFLGRRDQQVKLQGYRIELAEIESRIMNYPDIDGAAVLLRASQEDRQLWAYIISPNGKFSLDEIRKYLKEFLPEYMLPTGFSLVDNFPLTVNGKIDRDALARLSDGETQVLTSADFQMPRNDHDRRLVKIWSQLLLNEKIGLHDNFFESGGQSLMGVLLLAAIEQEFRVKLRLLDIFRYPVLADMSDLILSRSPNQGKSISRLPAMDHYPVSNAQRRLWILSNIGAETGAYDIAGTLLLKGQLNRGALERAIQRIVERHESLRTVFIVVKGEPRQKILEKPDFHIRIKSIGNSLQEEFNRNLKERFDLQKGPLFKAILYPIADDRHILFINMHHIISDGWSISVLTRELGQLYEAYLHGISDPLATLQYQYKDYTAWQNKMLGSDEFAEHRRFWHTKLAGELPVMNLPIDIARPSVRSFQGDAVRLMLDKAQTRDLNRLGVKQNVTLFIILKALVSVLLHRYSNQDDLIIGTSVAARERKELFDQIGFFVNTLALRTTISTEEPFSVLLERTKIEMLDAYEHQLYPFDLLVEELKIERDITRNPIFDVMLVLQNNEPMNLVFGGLVCEETDLDYAFSKFDLTFNFREMDGDLKLNLEYNTDIFHRERIERMGGHFEMLVKEVLRDSDCPIGKLQLLTASETQMLLGRFGEPEVVFPVKETIVSMFRRQLAQRADATALLYQDREMTYRELDERSNAVAARLKTVGALESNKIAAVILDRSDLAVAVFLGILKAGAAYLPIDPDYPPERIRYMLADSAATVLITEEKHSGEARKIIGDSLSVSEIIEIEKIDSSPEYKEEHFNSDTAAYIIYTSGSTGKPKGCIITHRNLISLIFNDRFPYKFSADDVWISAHSFCFDFSVWEMYGALLFGGRFVIISPDEVRRTDRFLDLLIEHQVTVLNQTPGAFYNLIEVEKQRESHDLAAHLRYVIFGGDRLDPHYLKPWLKNYPLNRISLINMFGITETTIHVTYGPLTEKDILASTGTSPIGRPLPDLNVYLFDEQMNLVPVGVPGEIWVGGPQVSPGYLNRPDLNRERFITSPFKAGETLYRSGDLAGWNSDGSLEYLGRNDHQVQVRGFRIEPAEIERMLCMIQTVEQALVLYREIQAFGQSRLALIAYLTSENDIDQRKLRRELKEFLPDYMIPEYFIRLGEFPLTSNGKIDRKALPLPGQNPVESASSALPGSDLEREILEIWQELLGIREIGVYDNFFEIGGSSLLIIQLHSIIEEKYPGKTRITDLFSHANIAALADFISGAEEEMSNVAEPLLFPARYFGRIRGEPSEFRFEIKDDLYQKIRDLCSNGSIGCLDFYVSAVIYLLYEITEQDQIQLLMNLAEADAWYLFKLDLAAIDGVTELIKFVKESRNRNGDGTRWEDLQGQYEFTADHHVVPMIRFNSSNRTAVRGRQTGDFYLEFSEKRDRLEGVLQCGDRFNRKMIRGILDLYMEVLQSFLQEIEHEIR